LSQYIKDLTVNWVGISSTHSNAIKNFWDCTALTLFFTSSGVYNIFVENTDTGTNFLQLYSADVAVKTTGPGAMVISPAPFRQLKVQQSTASTGTAIPVTAVYSIM
jgi:hypothetical protein